MADSRRAADMSINDAFRRRIGNVRPKFHSVMHRQRCSRSAASAPGLLYGDSGYKLVFSEPARPIGPIPFGDAPSGTMQGPRYTSFERLKTAKKVTELVVKI
jgi:hypothetical protein